MESVSQAAHGALLTIFYVAGPILGVILVIGVVVAVFLAVTQINEPTLSFVPKFFATVGKRPAVKAQPARTTMATDAFGRNTPQWLAAVEGREEGPRSVVVGLPGQGGAAEYLTPEEALAFAERIVAAIEEYHKEPAAP